uniref:Major sperm protein n=1 Tax=Parascaris univalens TaxID=6257 RepID=A0A915A3Y8_PARUN
MLRRQKPHSHPAISTKEAVRQRTSNIEPDRLQHPPLHRLRRQKPHSHPAISTKEAVRQRTSNIEPDRLQHPPLHRSQIITSERLVTQVHQVFYERWPTFLHYDNAHRNSTLILNYVTAVILSTHSSKVARELQ